MMEEPFLPVEKAFQADFITASTTTISRLCQTQVTLERICNSMNADWLYMENQVGIPICRKGLRSHYAMKGTLMKT